ncbi:hypothetical protein RCL1_008157 [Eukaryota sp. TZLM3-RCL]
MSETAYIAESGFKHGGFSSVEASLRLGFIRKVYSILAVQLFITASISWMMMQNVTATVNFLSNNIWVLWFSLIGAFVVLIATMCVKKVFPINLILLGVFTVLESVVIGLICALSDATAVTLAFFATMGIFVSLTLYAWTTKKDYTVYHGTAISLLFALFFVGIFGFWFNVPLLQSVYNFAGVAIFSLFVVIDTQMIASRLDYDDYVEGAIQLYLDILNLFLHLLRIFSK